MSSLIKTTALIAVCVLICIGLHGRNGVPITHNVDADSRYGDDEWESMSKQERTTVVAYYLMGKLSTAEASCDQRLSSELGNTPLGMSDVIGEYKKRCGKVEGISEIHGTKAGELTSEAGRMCTIIDQWYRLFPQKKRVPFLALVDAISNLPILSAQDLDAQFNSRLYLR